MGFFGLSGDTTIIEEVGESQYNRNLHNNTQLQLKQRQQQVIRVQKKTGAR